MLSTAKQEQDENSGGRAVENCPGERLGGGWGEKEEEEEEKMEEIRSKNDLLKTHLVILDGAVMNLEVVTMKKLHLS